MVPDPETTGMQDGRKGLRRLESSCRAHDRFWPVRSVRAENAAVLRRAGEIIAEEKSAMTSGGVPHLPHPHVVMPDRDVVATPKCALRDFEPCDGLPPRCRIDGISRLQYNSHMLFGAPDPRVE